MWVRQAEEGDEAQIFRELPYALRNEVSWQLCKAVFSSEAVLKDLDHNTKQVLASKMTPLKLAPGHMLCHQGGQADRIWLLQEGQAALCPGPLVDVAMLQHKTHRILPSILHHPLVMPDTSTELQTQPMLPSAWCLQCKYKPAC